VIFVPGLLAASVEVVQPFILGCDTKNPKIVQLSLVAVQRLISQQLLSKVLFCVETCSLVLCQCQTMSSDKVFEKMGDDKFCLMHAISKQKSTWLWHMLRKDY